VRERGDVELDRSRNGLVGLQISNAIGRLHKELTGRGPDKVRTYFDEDLIVCVLEGGYTRAEKTLQQEFGDEPVIEMRLQLQAAMRSAIVATVQAIVGREVRSFMSANDPAHNIQAELIVLVPDASAERTSSGHEELVMRGRQAVETSHSLREERSAVMAQREQFSRTRQQGASGPALPNGEPNRPDD
jgi:uncharacterized protein YbcI